MITLNLFDKQRAAMGEIFAGVTNVDPEAFTRERLTVTSRPEPAVWPFTAMVVGFGTGAVICVEERYAAWAKEQSPASEHEAFYLGYRLAAEAGSRGEALDAGPPTVGWALSRLPNVAAPPDGCRLERVDCEWMNAWQPRNLFRNALGAPEQQHRSFRNQFAFVVFDAAGEPAAVAGVYDSAGLWEIGVDVRRSRRGERLAPAVVAAAARAIVDAGGTAFYECVGTNTRSMRTALDAGFTPVCSVALVYAEGLGMAAGRDA